MNDIIEVGPFEAQKELLYDLERRSNRRLDTIRQLTDSVDMSNGPLIVVHGLKMLKMLYDLGSHHFYFMFKTFLLPIDPRSGVILASTVEEWLFGEKITIGHVPRILRLFNQRPPDDFTEFMKFHDSGNLPPVTRPWLYFDPLLVLVSYIWLLHKLADGVNHFSDFSLGDSGYATFHGILNIFVALMDGHNCPVCQAPILNRIKERFPQLSLELINIIFPAVPSVPRYSQASVETEPRSIPLDDILR
ncbi:hypothetical protein F5Y02DRAFT_223910 [Annulohypoxylon stygium]|nr:hypothetical protein F5Y02DRAFT_223910 [Annulohypoxylon stygium]